MEPIPTGWPPEGSGTPFVAPLFPLPRAWLFPRIVLPLHVFEPRYRTLVEDCLDGPGRIVLGTIVAGHEKEHLEAPPVEPIAGLGEIGRHERMPDGRFQIWLFGLARVRIREIDSDKPYRLAEVDPIDEAIPPGEETDELRASVTAAIQKRVDDVEDVPDNVPLSSLVDFLALRMELPHRVMQRLYSEVNPVTRARATLREHARRP